MTKRRAIEVLRALIDQHEDAKPAHMDKDNDMSHPVINSFWLEKKLAMEMGLKALKGAK